MPPSKVLRRTRKVRPMPAQAGENTFRKSGGNAGARTIKMGRRGNTKELVPLLSINKRGDLLDPFDYTIDPASAAAGRPVMLEPEIPFNLLLKAAKSNSALPQCIEAYVVNIESYGFQLEYIGAVGKEQKPGMQSEFILATDFLENCCEDGSLREIRERRRRDLETLGEGYFEIGRDLGGRPAYINHVPTVMVRKTRRDVQPTNYTILVRSASGQVIKKDGVKRFRRFVQLGPLGQRIYFKEFGDPRSIDPATGSVNPNLAIEQQATEIFEEDLYSPGMAYGQPRWIGALPDMLGLRESEVVNLNFFRENAIPAMAVLISGGALTEESYEKVVNVINAAKGQDAMNRILILEAAADDAVGDADKAPPAPRIDLKPLGTDRQSDGLFENYQKNAKRKIRSTMRLPALYTGDSEEYTKATAQSALRIAESQVFAPERSKFDDFINHRLFPALGIVNWKFRTLGPSVYDPDTLSTMIDRFGRQGAMTPNILVKIANQVLDVQIPPVTEDWGNIPFSYITAMAGAGRELVGFEGFFKDIVHYAVRENEQATVNADGEVTSPSTPVAAPAAGAGNDNVAAQALKNKLANELIDLSNDLIERIHDAKSEALYDE